MSLSHEEDDEEDDPDERRRVHSKGNAPSLKMAVTPLSALPVGKPGTAPNADDEESVTGARFGRSTSVRR